jgi:hypothetical protein
LKQALKFAKLYLEQFALHPVDWVPLQDSVDFYQKYRQLAPVSDEDWQFNSFLVP